MTPGRRPPPARAPCSLSAPRTRRHHQARGAPAHEGSGPGNPVSGSYHVVRERTEGRKRSASGYGRTPTAPRRGQTDRRTTRRSCPGQTGHPPSTRQPRSPALGRGPNVPQLHPSRARQPPPRTAAHSTRRGTGEAQLRTNRTGRAAPSRLRSPPPDPPGRPGPPNPPGRPDRAWPARFARLKSPVAACPRRRKSRRSPACSRPSRWAARGARLPSAPPQRRPPAGTRTSVDETGARRGNGRSP